MAGRKSRRRLSNSPGWKSSAKRCSAATSRRATSFWSASGSGCWSTATSGRRSPPRFDWSEILDRKETYTLQAAAALLHHDSLAPDQGASLLEGLDENAHKHAFGVSEDLKYALHDAIELLGNEAVHNSAPRRKPVSRASTPARTPWTPATSASSACAWCIA